MQHSTRAMIATARTLFFLITIILGVPQSLQAQQKRKLSIKDHYEQGRLAFYANKIISAEIHFQKVLKAVPNHKESLYFAGLIKARKKKATGGNAMEIGMRRTILKNIEFHEATLEEVVRFLRIKGREASGKTFQPNFILKGLSDEDKAKPITLQLTNVPLDQVLKAIGSIGDWAFRYSEHAITIYPKPKA